MPKRNRHQILSSNILISWSKVDVEPVQVLALDFSARFDPFFGGGTCHLSSDTDCEAGTCAFVLISS